MPSDDDLDEIRSTVFGDDLAYMEECDHEDEGYSYVKAVTWKIVTITAGTMKLY